MVRVYGKWEDRCKFCISKSNWVDQQSIQSDCEYCLIKGTIRLTAESRLHILQLFVFGIQNFARIKLLSRSTPLRIANTSEFRRCGDDYEMLQMKWVINWQRQNKQQLEALAVRTSRLSCESFTTYDHVGFPRHKALGPENPPKSLDWATCPDAKKFRLARMSGLRHIYRAGRSKCPDSDTYLPKNAKQISKYYIGLLTRLKTTEPQIWLE